MMFNAWSSRPKPRSVLGRLSQQLSLPHSLNDWDLMYFPHFVARYRKHGRGEALARHKTDRARLHLPRVKQYDNRRYVLRGNNNDQRSDGFLAVHSAPLSKLEVDCRDWISSNMVESSKKRHWAPQIPLWRRNTH